MASTPASCNSSAPSCVPTGTVQFTDGGSFIGSANLSNGLATFTLGGGTPTAPGATALLKQAQTTGAQILYLRATAQTLRARLALA